VLTASNALHGIADLVIPVERRSQERFIFPLSALSPHGAWSLHVAASQSHTYDATADFSLTIPQDIESARIDPVHPPFTLFSLGSLIGAFFLLLVGVGCFCWSKMLQTKITANSKDSFIVQFNERGSWIFPLLIFGTLFHVLGGPYTAHSGKLQSSFERLCNANGHFWQESVALQNGQALASQAYAGCSVGHSQSGRFHFSHQQEYEYFVQPARSRAQLTTLPATIIAGQPAQLLINLRDDSGKPVQELSINHERMMHVMIISKDMSVFSHIHAEDAGPITQEMKEQGRFPITYTFPTSGTYLIAVGYTVRATEFSEIFQVHIQGNTPQFDTPKISSQKIQTVNDYTVTLTTPDTIRAKVPVTLSYLIQKNGYPITTLQPYLSAPMHISVIRQDLQEFVHAHGQIPLSWVDYFLGSNQHQMHGVLPPQFGPVIEAPLIFPTAGRYYVVGEFNDNNKIVPVTFRIDVQ
jgi:hypothetical protein